MKIFSLNSIINQIFAVAVVVSVVATPIVYGSSVSVDLNWYHDLKLELVDGVYDLCQLDEERRDISHIFLHITVSDPFYYEDIDSGLVGMPLVHIFNGDVSSDLIYGDDPYLSFFEEFDYASPYFSYAAEGLHQLFILGNYYTYTVKSCDTQPEPAFKLIHGPSLLSWDFIMATIYVCEYYPVDEWIAWDASNSFFQYITPDLEPTDQLRMNHWIDEELVLKTKLTAWDTSHGGTEYRYNEYLSDDIDFSDPSFLTPGVHSIVLRPPKGSDHPFIKYQYRVINCIS